MSKNKDICDNIKMYFRQIQAHSQGLPRGVSKLKQNGTFLCPPPTTLKELEGQMGITFSLCPSVQPASDSFQVINHKLLMHMLSALGVIGCW